MRELFKIVNDHAARVRAQEDRELAALNDKRRRKAERKMATRITIAVVGASVLEIADALGILPGALVVALQCATLVWLSVWFGAWLQLMLGKDGLLE